MDADVREVRIGESNLRKWRRGARAILGAVCVATVLLSGTLAHAATPVVIAHRGASGYLPEHTLEAYAMAHAMGADYIEQDLVMTRDKRLIALHDIHLEKTTDVEQRYPRRHRKDGRWYAADFTLAEIKKLTVHERTNRRFPVGKAHFEVPTFEEAIELVQGLNQTRGRNVGIYPELKGPSFHHDEGFQIEAAVLSVLKRHGYEGPDARVYVQCFEAESLKRIRHDLGSELPLVLLVSNHEAQADMRTEEGLQAVAAYANGVGPNKGIIEKNPAFVAWAHAAGLVVHPYTIRDDDVPGQYESVAAELRQFFVQYGVDGVFTDFPDTARAAANEMGAE